MHRAALLLLSGLLPLVAAARVEQSDLYETATVRARDLATATSTVTVLDRAEIEALQVQSVAELLRFVPGVDITSGGARSGATETRTRGGDPNTTTILLDGVPLNDPTDTFGGTANVNALTTSSIERIEVVRGPLSSSFGSTGIAGAINIVTRKAEGDDFTFGVGLEAAQDLVGTTAWLSHGGSRNGYFLGVTWYDEEQQYAADAFEQVAVQGRADLSLGETADLRVTGRVTSWEADDYPEASGGPNRGDGMTRRSVNDEASVGVVLDFGRSSSRQRLYANAYRHVQDRDTPAVMANPADPFNFLPASRQRTRYGVLRVGFAPPVLELGPSRLSFGVEAQHEDGENSGQLALPQVGPVPTAYHLKRTTGGAYAELVSQLGDWTLEAGARLDLPDRTDAELNPRLGARYQIHESTAIRASAGRAFKLPSFFSLADPLVGNPTLDPETSIGVDLGVEQRFVGDAVIVGLTVFQNRFEHLIDFDPAQFRIVNLDDPVRVRGVELAFDWSPIERIDVRLNVTRQSFSRDPGQRRDWIGGLRASWRVLQALRWEVDIQSVSEMQDFQIPTGVGEVDGYYVAGSAVSWSIGRHWDVHGRVDNLTDEEYENFIGFAGPDRVVRVGARFRSQP